MFTSVWPLLTALVLGGVVYLLVARVRKGTASGRRIVVGEMMSRHGLEMKSIAEHGLEDELVARARTCLECEDYKTCIERLRTTGKPNYQDICPNAAFIDGLKGQA
ncbi:MAG: hypothetical protein JJ900_18505 [Rhodospirillales bacterium]|nr:hypothetical protein [Rhodospirillales bacterium]MBO6788845.1 hypothetical protein [Rhodospirillales bacterium]